VLPGTRAYLPIARGAPLVYGELGLLHVLGRWCNAGQRLPYLIRLLDFEYSHNRYQNVRSLDNYILRR
jgi:hypothetical protein